MTTELDEARVAEKEAVQRRQAAEKAEREAIGYPEFDTKEWQQHQWDLACRYSELEHGQLIRMSAVPGVHGGTNMTGGVADDWTVVANDKLGMLMLMRGGNTACHVDYRNAYPYGLGDILKELEVLPSEAP